MNELKVIEQQLVNFNGAEVMVAKTQDGKVFAAVKWICEGIGLTRDQTKHERKKVQEDLVLSKGGRNLTLPTNGGLQEIQCIELDFLPLWLAKISITPKMRNEAPWTARNLVEYQLKAKDVLAQAFIPKQPSSPLEIMQMQIQQMIEHDKRIKDVEHRMQATEEKQENISNILLLNPAEWRSKVTTILNRIGQTRGGFEEFRNVRNESYEVLEQRGRCKLEVRVNNRKKEMALNGVPKSKISKVSKIDVIAEDTRLTEIYLAIVKEMAIKYQVNATEIA
ncbi:phage antirepressor N-terminal domain-containing protein [Viridibacillus sp. NPDC096237]|uniref:phage antirepressor N-terminal domain-containing protein n=1 Tax=Viridibacillus sp. NPDC096237 TaxID=3390721 RepID=UPI003D034D5A